MRKIVIHTLAALMCSGCLSGLFAQQPRPATPLTTVPRVVRISSSFHPANGLPPAPVEGVTLSIYAEERGGAPLWHETQNVSVDAGGQYSVLMGSTLNEGLPLELLSSGEPRWLGVQFNRPEESEQARVLLVSVPFALKASDADTLGGKPASAYMLLPGAVSEAVHRSTKPAITAASTVTSGSVSANTQEFYGQTGFVVNDATGALTGISVQNTSGGAASYSGMLFYDQNGALGQFQGFNNSTHEYRINNIASNGSINFMIGSSSKFRVANNGDIGIAGNVGIGTTTPNANLQVATGDVYVSNPGSGMILKSPDGSKCTRISLHDQGFLVTTSLTCP